MPIKQRNDKPSKRGLLHGGEFALGIVVGAGLLLVGLLFVTTGGTVLSRQELLDFVPATIALVVALASLLITRSSLLEQRRMRQAGTDPVVICHLGQRSDAPMIITFNISNVGAGAALDVELDVEEPPHQLQEKLLNRIFGKHHPIRAILQNTSVSISLGAGYELVADDALPKFRIKVSYKDIDGNGYQDEQYVDVQELLMRDANEPPIASISKSLKEISKASRKLTSGQHKQVVLTQPLKEYEQEQRNLLEKMKAKRNK